MAILLTDGPDRDWLKNIVSADGGRMKRYGKTFELTETAGDAQGRGGTGGQRPVAADLRAAAVRTGGAAEARLVCRAVNSGS